MVRVDVPVDAVEPDYAKEATSVVRSAMPAAARLVNLAMVYAYFEVGRVIVEEERSGSDCAAGIRVSRFNA